MTNAPGPPGYPPYQQPPRNQPANRSSATIVTALLAVLFSVATALAAWAAHDHDTASAAGAPVVGVTGGPQQSGTAGGIPAGGGASYPSGVPTFPTPSTSSYSYTPPAPLPSPTHQPLSAETINRTFQLYMSALLNRSLSQLKSATCPKLRHTETGTALDGKYISRWKGHTYRIYDSLDYVIVAATVRYVNPNTGGDGGTHVYSWYVSRYPDGHYWVCGILG